VRVWDEGEVEHARYQREPFAGREMRDDPLLCEKVADGGTSRRQADAFERRLTFFNRRRDGGCGRIFIVFVFVLVNVDDIDGNATFGRGAHERSQGLRHTAAATDHLTEIVAVNFEFEHCPAVVRMQFDCNRIGFRNETFREKREQFGCASVCEFDWDRIAFRSRFAPAKAGTTRIEGPLFGRAAARAAAETSRFVLRFDFVDDRLAARYLARTERRAALVFGRFIAEESEFVVERAHRLLGFAFGCTLFLGDWPAFDQAARRKQTPNRIGRLRALGEPFLDLLFIENDCLRFSARIVVTDDFEEPPVAR